MSWIGERGYLGAAFSRQEPEYGLLAHEHIDCHTHRQTEWHCGGYGEYADPFVGFELVKSRVSHTDYEQDHHQLSARAVLGKWAR